MKKQTKTVIKKIVNLMLVLSVALFAISTCLVCVRLGLGWKFDPPFCWASFLQMGLLMLSGWAFNKELFYY
jgi:hypothetical protein